MLCICYIFFLVIWWYISQFIDFHFDRGNHKKKKVSKIQQESRTQKAQTWIVQDQTQTAQNEGQEEVPV